MDELRDHAAAEAEQVTDAHATENALTVVGEDVAAVEHTEAMQRILEVGKLVGRVQSAQVLATVADSIQASQLRQLKDLHKDAGLTWEQTCNIIGMSRRTADLYLKQAADLGDDFFGNCRRLGVSVRTMEAARQLPEPVRQALAQGEVVDLETVSKEALTDAIRTLAIEHAKESAAAAESLGKETKAREKAEKKAKEAAEKAEALAAELEAQKEGLPAEDKKALEQLRQVEFSTMAFLVRIKNTLEVAERDPGFMARVMGSLSLIENMAALTSKVISARMNGEEMDEEAYALAAAGAQADNLDNANFDQRAAYPGI